MSNDTTKIWYYQVKGAEEYYTFNHNYKTVYFPIAEKDPHKIRDELNQIRKDKKLHPAQDISKYSGCDLFYTDVKEISEAQELPAGQYLHLIDRFSSKPERLIKFDFRTDGYLDIFDKAHEIETEINTFIADEAIYKSIPSLHKMGILLYGPPGEGKSSFLRHLVNKNDKFKDAIIISVNEFLPSVEFLQKLNSSTKGRMKIIILEEVTNLIQGSEAVRQLLTFLDGETSIDNCVVLATTNYPELLPANIIDRQGRFDNLYKMGSPTSIEAKKLVEYYYKNSPTEEELKALSGKSTAFIQRCCLNARIKKVSLLESLNHVNKMFSIVKNDFKERKMGFSEETF